MVRTNAYATRPPHLATTPAATSPRGAPPPPPPPPPPPHPSTAFPSSSWRRSRGNAVPGTARLRCLSSRPCHSSRRSAARSSTIGSSRRPRPPWATRTSVRVVLTLTEWARVPFVTSPTHGIHVYPLCNAATLLPLRGWSQMLPKAIKRGCSLSSRSPQQNVHSLSRCSLRSSPNTRPSPR